MKHHVTNREYWRSLEELADGPEVRQLLEKEFPGYDPEEIVSLSRRSFMRMMGASLAMAGVTLTGCRRWPEEKLVPYTVAPKNLIPGIPEQYATIMDLGGVAQGLLVSSFDGRPIKIEGNPSHPFSQTVPEKLGSADAMSQASILELYDPDRSRSVVEVGQTPKISTWEEFRAVFDPAIVALRAAEGAGLAVLAESSSSPTTARLKAAYIKAFPKAVWCEYDAVSIDRELEGSRQAFGKNVRSRLHLDKAAVVVSLDADLLGSHPAHTRHAADWATTRRSADSGKMSRFYIAESTFSITGTVADERLPIRLSRIGPVLVALAAKLGINAGAAGNLTPQETKFVDDAATDLQSHHGQAVLAIGSHLPAEFHHIGHAINEKLGAPGATVTLLEMTDADRPTHLEAIGKLAASLKSGSVNTLLILGGNPAFNAPAELDLANLIAAVPLSVQLGLYIDETSKVCKWHVPRAHYLESWGDGRAWDGTISVQQPLIEPLYGGKSAQEFLAMLVGEKNLDGDALVRSTFAGLLPGDGFENSYRKVLHDGLLAGSGYKAFSGAAKEASAIDLPAPPMGLEVRFLPDLKVYDGRFANNGWLQEMPHPLTKVTWDNPICMSVKDAADLGVSSGDMVTLGIDGKMVEGALYVLPGQPIGVLGLSLGYGRSSSGNIGTGIGFDMYTGRTSKSFFGSTGVTLARTGDSHSLATTQNQHLIDAIGANERDERIGHRHESGELIHEATFTEFKADKSLFTRKADGTIGLQLFEPPLKFNDPHAWGMAVDMNSCIGCNACVVACQAENNIPVVGKEQVANNRAMHWIRIDRWFKGDATDPDIDVAYQPIMCQHCENAPCEQVCPVAATVHDTEGLNTMVYNRCIGTRYCSNNCPYKVRRFNYLDWHSKDPRGWAKPWLNIPDLQQREMVDKIKRMVFNPDVTVRMRGVMEKCTYCVQRIHAVQIAKGNQQQPIEDGDIVTACQQACPTQAIVFGDLNDPNAQVTRLHQNQRAYTILNELNTRPRTHYLAKVRNPATAETERTA